MFFPRNFLAASDSGDFGAIIFLIVIVAVLAMIFGKKKKQTTVWVPVQVKRKGCLVLIIAGLAAAAAISALVAAVMR